jgi:hypothetical protein
MPDRSSRPRICETLSAVRSFADVIVPSTSITTKRMRNIFATRSAGGSKINDIPTLSRSCGVRGDLLRFRGVPPDTTISCYLAENSGANERINNLVRRISIVGFFKEAAPLTLPPTRLYVLVLFEGRFATVTSVGVECDGRGAGVGRTAGLRTDKPCGPGAPGLALSLQ